LLAIKEIEVQPFKIGICGLGTVGAGSYQLLTANRQQIAQRLGYPVDIELVATRRDNPNCPIAQSQLTRDIFAVADHPQIDLVIELIGGTDTARELVLAAIKQGKDVVTANKALIAVHGNELFAAAKQAGVSIAFEAAVAGGIPIIKALREGLSANKIQAIAGIINGTSNFILSSMQQQGCSFAEMLKEAQRLGYAEADPSFDVNGMDAAHKLSILAALAFGIPISLDEVYTEGIEQIDAQDIGYAEELGYRIKHLAIAKHTSQGVELRVHPTLIAQHSLLAQVSGVMNAVRVNADALGESLYYGAGAGAQPTASAVVADIIDLARQRTLTPAQRVPYLGFQQQQSLPVLAITEVKTAYYLRMTAADHPGVLSAVTSILSAEGISIEAVIQKEAKTNEQSVPLVMLLHPVVERQMDQALSKIGQIEDIYGTITRIRLEGL
jgi:homoserine dehydrogenase